jgi:ribose transport system ATP-binding protein
MVEELSIDCPSADSLVVNLSGGNQQKVVVARWLGRPIKVLLLDDPTRGIDVGAKAEVHRLIARLADEGIGILFTSSDLGELIGICDRVVVLREGRLVGEFGRSEATQHNVLAAAMDYESGASPETGAVE